jgi:hypothetical protein
MPVSARCVFGVQTDLNNQLVRMIDLTSGAVSSLCGNRVAGYPADGIGTAAIFGWPAGVALNAAGSVALVVS